MKRRDVGETLGIVVDLELSAGDSGQEMDKHRWSSPASKLLHTSCWATGESQWRRRLTDHGSSLFIGGFSMASY